MNQYANLAKCIGWALQYDDGFVPPDTVQGLATASTPDQIMRALDLMRYGTLCECCNPYPFDYDAVCNLVYGPLTTDVLDRIKDLLT